MNQRKIALFFVLAFFMALSFGLTTQTVSAQEDGGGEDGVLYAPKVDTNTEQNIYLDNQVKSTEAKQTTLSPAAQNVNGNRTYTNSTLSCPYVFTRDLYVGLRGEDVKLLQIILNSDERTVIAATGVASKGQETTYFGPATKDAVKRFQALFIEYIGIANGRMGPKSRTVLNAICNGSATVSSGNSLNNVQSVQINATAQGETTVVSNDRISPRVYLSANLNAVEYGLSFKIVANFSEEIKKFSPENLIIDGGSVKEIRKLSKTTYGIGITPDENSKRVVIQIEADAIEDLAGNRNENASNEIAVNVVRQGTNTVTSTTTGTSNVSIDSLINTIISQAPQCNYNQNGILITGTNINTTGCPTQQTVGANCTYNSYGQLITTTGLNTSGCAQTSTANSQMQNCNGQMIPITQQCTNPYQQAQQQQQQAQQAQQTSMLGELLGRLLGGNKNNQANQQTNSGQQGGTNNSQTGGGSQQSRSQTPNSTEGGRPTDTNGDEDMGGTIEQKIPNACTGFVKNGNYVSASVNPTYKDSYVFIYKEQSDQKTYAIGYKKSDKMKDGKSALEAIQVKKYIIGKAESVDWGKCCQKESTDKKKCLEEFPTINVGIDDGAKVNWKIKDGGTQVNDSGTGTSNSGSTSGTGSSLPATTPLPQSDPRTSNIYQTPQSAQPIYTLPSMDQFAPQTTITRPQTTSDLNGREPAVQQPTTLTCILQGNCGSY